MYWPNFNRTEAAMHEASLMVALMRNIDAVAAQEGADRVTAVRVRLGALSHMTPDHFRVHSSRLVLALATRASTAASAAACWPRPGGRARARCASSASV